MSKKSQSKTVAAFTKTESVRPKLLLTAKVARMMGRKMEEDDWISVYCKGNQIPESSWSNLNIDVMHLAIDVNRKPNLEAFA